MKVNYRLQDEFLKEFFTSRFGEKFYLTGGTALARFYFHHRVSVDLDLFTNIQEVDFAGVQAEARRIFSTMKLKIEKAVLTDTFIQYIAGSLKVDLVKDVPVHFGKIRIKNGVRIDSLENIGSNKILAIFGRIDPKDFIDLYFILHKSKLSFDQLYGLAGKKDLGLTEFYLAGSVDNFLTKKPKLKLTAALDRKDFLKFYGEIKAYLLKRAKPAK
ncbi:MAG: nucleotidyl transferase AbiEii/AbiGii toxin family protein [Patescibacteria group bacterium]|nr:nucleotidyl transferase AbiEii/AbiGii toxin family protein [Patescibacteria group bacterium]